MFFAEQVLNQVAGNGLRDRDEKIDIREVMIMVDQVVSELAKGNYLDNWKLGYGQMDEMYLTRWNGLTITDPGANINSYVPLPTSGYVSLPRNQGIYEVTFANDPTKVTRKYFNPIHIISQKDSITYRNNMAGALQGRVSAYINGRNLVFSTSKVGATYGLCNITLVVKDSSNFAETDPFPVDAAIEQTIIDRCVKYFINRRSTPGNLVRDNNSAIA